MRDQNIPLVLFAVVVASGVVVLRSLPLGISFRASSRAVRSYV